MKAAPKKATKKAAPIQAPPRQTVQAQATVRPTGKRTLNDEEVFELNLTTKHYVTSEIDEMLLNHILNQISTNTPA